MAGLVRSTSITWLQSVSLAAFILSTLASSPVSGLLSSARAQSADADEKAAPAGAPNDGRPRFLDIEVGFDRAYKVGCWTPVRVIVSPLGIPAGKSVSGVLKIETTDGDDAPCVYESTIQLVSGNSASEPMYVRFGSSTPTMILKLEVGGSEVLRETVNSQEGLRPGFEAALPAEERLVLCIGRSSTIDEVTGRNGVEHWELARFDDVSQLPIHSYGYDGVDAVLLAADDVRRYAKLTPDGPQVAALSEWLQSGGNVTIVAGDDARLLFGSAAWRKLAPINVGDPVPLPNTEKLEAYAGGTKPVPAAAAADRLRVLRSTDKNDVVEQAAGDLPLVVRRAVGLGVLTVSFVDLEHSQLRNWEGRAAFLARAMRLGPITDEGASNKSSYNYQSYGYNDLSGQLRSALDQYEGVAVISFFVLALMILVYIALIGPFDYLLVRKVFRRTEMTWFTFPAIVILTSAGAYFAARWMKGDELRVSQVDIIDCDVATNSVRGTMFAGVFSPKSDEYAVRVEPPKELLAANLTSNRSITSWLGLSGGGYGGMHGRTSGATSWLTSAYEVDPDLAALHNVPIQVWSSKMFYSRWQAKCELKKSSLHLAADKKSLAGKLYSPLQIPLERPLLCYDTKAYTFDRLEKDTPYDVTKFRARELSTELHQAEVIKAAKAHTNPSMRTQPHDPESTNIDTIVRKMMFYDAAGGKSHASLANDYQGDLDFSELLKLNRAVLVGYVDTSADDGATLDLTVDGKAVTRSNDRRWVFVRVVIPVETAAESQ